MHYSHSIIILFIFCFSYVSHLNVHAFLGEDLWINMYKNIEKGYEELEIKNYEYELTAGEDSIIDNVKKFILLQEEISTLSEWAWGCIDTENDGLTVEDLQQISNGKIQVLYDKIYKHCDIWVGITIQELMEMQSYIKQVWDIAKQNAQEKTWQMNRIARIWIYSDGISENSSFDLITDLEDINAIIFSEDLAYEGEEYENIDDYLESQFFINTSEDENKIDKGGNLIRLNIPKSPPLLTSDDTVNVDDDSLIPIQTEIITTPYVCIDEENSHVKLDANSIANIVNSIESRNTQMVDSKEKLVDWVEISTIWEGKTDEDDEVTEDNIANPEYAVVNDNALWPCNNFFCITVDFVIYNHKLLWGGSTSIEYLINRSNEHLKKFSNTSMVQAKMGTNNFELGLKDLNLPDIFNINVQVSSRPVPILKLNKNDKKKQDELSGKWLLEAYYKTKGLEYERRNDLKSLNSDEKMKKSIIDSVGLNNIELVEKVDVFLEHMTDEQLQYDQISKNIDKLILIDDMDEFWEQFAELEVFSNSIYKYSVSINNIIREMLTIPVE